MASVLRQAEANTTPTHLPTAAIWLHATAPLAIPLSRYFFIDSADKSLSFFCKRIRFFSPDIWYWNHHAIVCASLNWDGDVCASLNWGNDLFSFWCLNTCFEYSFGLWVSDVSWACAACPQLVVQDVKNPLKPSLCIELL